MEFRELATIAGKGGLFKILKPTKNGVILESLDDKKAKLVAGTSHRVSILNEISIYTTDTEGTKPLEEVMIIIEKEFKGDIDLDSKSSDEELRSFLKHVLPEYDADRVYVSDIKKLVSWYKILRQHAPEVLQPAKEEVKAEKPVKEKAAKAKEEPKAKAPKKAKKSE